MTPRTVQEVITGSMPAVPEEGYIVVESTANGNNHFRDFWEQAVNGENNFTPHFYNWTWADEYTEKPPTSNEWKSDYMDIAKEYNLIQDLQERIKLTDPQFYWYFNKARVLKEFTKQELPSIPEEAFLSTGRNVFNLFKIANIKTTKPIDRFKDVVRVFVHPDKEHTYIIGADTAEGVNKDSSSFVVMDNVTNDIVATFDSPTIEPHDFATLIVGTAKYYNESYIIAERNASGLTTVTKIRELNYHNVYINRSVDKLIGKMKNELGWRTTSANRDLMIDEFREAFHEGEIGIPDAKIRTQLETFIVKDNGKREHDNGKHDDLLFACFLAWQGKKFYSDLKVSVI